jgi:hypothetical protein
MLDTGEQTAHEDWPLVMTVIDPDGDLLPIMSSSTERHTILVSLRILCLASKVFTTMFSRHFKEGNEKAAK